MVRLLGFLKKTHLGALKGSLEEENLRLETTRGGDWRGTQRSTGSTQLGLRCRLALCPLPLLAPKGRMLLMRFTRPVTLTHRQLAWLKDLQVGEVGEPAFSCMKSGCESAGVTKGMCGMAGVSGSWGTRFSMVQRRECRMERRTHCHFV